MSEQTAVNNASLPRTKASLVTDLRNLGVQPGMVLLVHSSLQALGWVSGGPVAVIQAFMEVLTSTGTLVMPTHSSHLSDPADWMNPPVPQTWHQIIRDTMPAFDPRITPTRQMGAIPELFRTWPDVIRSNHPQVSFAAWGQYAQVVTADHPLTFSLGEGSPLAHIYRLDGYILLLGVGYGNNTSFHLAECRVPFSPRSKTGAPIMKDGRRVWQAYDEIDYNDGSFPELGADFEATHPIKIGLVGSATCRLFSQRIAVDFAEKWLINKQSRPNHS